MNIETERLIIKNGEIEDFLKVYEYNFLKLEDVGFEFVLEKQDLDQIKSWFGEDIREYYKDMESKNNYDLVLYLKESLTPIGNLLLDRINNDEKSIEITCHVHPSYWGNGYMKEAIVSVMPYLFNELGFEAIIYSYASGNKKSARLCSKIGFELESIKKNNYKRNGIQIDTYRNILTKDRYKELYGTKQL